MADPGAGIDGLNDVVVAGPAEAWAVGGTNGGNLTLALRWDGAAWSPVPTVNVGTGRNILNAVTLLRSRGAARNVFFGVARVRSAGVWAAGYREDEVGMASPLLAVRAGGWNEPLLPDVGLARLVDVTAARGRVLAVGNGEAGAVAFAACIP